MLCRDGDEDRYTFSSRLVGQTTPKRTNSLDSPAKSAAREWEEKGPRSGGERRPENGPVRRALDVNRPGPARVCMQSPHCCPSGKCPVSCAQLYPPLRMRTDPMLRRLQSGHHELGGLTHKSPDTLSVWYASCKCQ